jgi:hypothetical protein
MSQVECHGLTSCENLDDHLVDVFLMPVDPLILLHNQVGQSAVSFIQCGYGSADLDQARFAHLGDFPADPI